MSFSVIVNISSHQIIEYIFLIVKPCLDLVTFFVQWNAVKAII